MTKHMCDTECDGEFLEYVCPVCGEHVVIDLSTGEREVLVRGDVLAEHVAVVSGLSIESEVKRYENPFARWSEDNSELLDTLLDN